MFRKIFVSKETSDDVIQTNMILLQSKEIAGIEWKEGIFEMFICAELQGRETFWYVLVHEILKMFFMNLSWKKFEI